MKIRSGGSDDIPLILGMLDGAVEWLAAALVAGGPVPGAGLDMDTVFDRSMARLLGAWDA
ncbi:hypothetical protein [Bacillus thuringiensis]|uniref:hypothetical protein n=1 Tax=Bacillus thuringiensis TaxID=1428 RepID=UPI0035D797F3